jgi:hypothetical protein
MLKYYDTTQITSRMDNSEYLVFLMCNSCFQGLAMLYTEAVALFQHTLYLPFPGRMRQQEDAAQHVGLPAEI